MLEFQTFALPLIVMVEGHIHGMSSSIEDLNSKVCSL